MSEERREEKKEIKKSAVALQEERVLDFWNTHNIFSQSLAQKSPKGEFIFYDGPPFATGLPHYGHILPGTIKDVIPRYKTMRGYHVTRRWGWDCHGLPIENLIEKELGLNSKEEIKQYGIEKFNNAARESVFRYADQWKKIIPRTGRWVDFEDLYITMSPQYTESVWWMFSELYKKNLVSEGFKSMHLCPRCETTLSNFEVNQGYKDIVDISVTAQFELLDEEGTYVLAWTTTPWTLPGNVALAVNASIEYAKVKSTFEEKTNHFIVAKDQVEKVFKDSEHEVISTMFGTDLVGKAYKPLFNYYASDTSLENQSRGWKVYADNFVSTDEGTGIVHIAPAFGDEDYQLSKRENLPFVQHVQQNGVFASEVTDFTGLQVKPKDNHQQTDIEIIKYLAHNNLLFSKEKITHSYPHCWRCDSPLLNYATSSWFIEVTKKKDDLIKANNNVSWTPASVGENRFGNWLKEAKDWSISRSRFWGAPLPVWKSEDGTEVEVLSTLDDIKKRTKSSNTLFALRHGEAQHNATNIIDNTLDKSPLTEVGQKEVEKTAQSIKSKKIDLIIASPVLRAQQTAKIVAEKIGLPADQILTDERIREIDLGDLNGRPIEEFRSLYTNQLEKFAKAVPGGENLTDMKKRIGDFLYDIDATHTDKNILIVTHEYSVWMIDAVTHGWTAKEAADVKEKLDDYIHTGDFKHIDFAPIPHNDTYDRDYHRPYIDDITYEKNGKQMNRIPEVFDTWIDSGSVPYASFHYPYDKTRVNPKPGWFKKALGYPADFIGEGIDQTRGWFYSMLVLNTLLFGKAPFKQVVVNGTLLAEDGRKMSKRLKNYPEVSTVLDTYGADALRYFLMTSPAVKAEEVSFSEKAVDEVMKKIIGRLNNIVSLYEMFATSDIEASSDSKSVLDQWIVARLHDVRNQVTNSLEAYELDRASRPFMDFVDDVSTWYIRRSRDRFKQGGEDAMRALQTTKYVLIESMKLLAPFMPFVSESVYQAVTGSQYNQESQSVHLTSWPQEQKVNTDLLEKMEAVRSIVTQILDARTEAGIRVRQPLQAVTIKQTHFQDDTELIELVRDEVNIKEIRFDSNQETAVMLDTNLSPQLLQEGAYRELLRHIQSLRKKEGLSPDDSIRLAVYTSAEGESLINSYEKQLEETAGVGTIRYEDVDTEELKANNLTFKVGIKKI